jgi:hydroxyethylthiazole kinase
MNELTQRNTTTLDRAFADLDLIRQHHPLIHNLTNIVVMQTTANCLLALGASPIMAHAKEELADIVALANALVINMGTLDETWVQAAQYGQQQALRRGIPIIFDPVGAGASSYRTKAAKRILDNGIDVLRANASEILALVKDNIKTKGVDSTYQSEEAMEAAAILSNQYQCTIIISGKIDVIIQGHQQARIPYGTPLFTHVTGMGCSATAVIAAFSAINHDYFHAAKHAMTLFTLAGQLAATRCQGPGSFYTTFVDALYALKKDDIIPYVSKD